MGLCLICRFLRAHSFSAAFVLDDVFLSSVSFTPNLPTNIVGFRGFDSSII